MAITLATVAALSATNALCADKAEKPEKEAKLTKKDIPGAVLTAFEKSYPKASIKEVGGETEDSVKIFEIESTDGGVRRTVTYTADGRVFEIEEVVALKDAPAPVQQAIAKEYPKGKVEKVEKVTKGDVATFEIVAAQGKERTEVVLDASGKVLETEKKGDRKKDND
ncbi:MAG: PepSY-like domain-containing protein [candidate division Zixibacteria bacterium]|nr:PepSY-like domain-containing protein [candidate division Zixibacteria bacterium]